MFCKREVYRIKPENISEFTSFFENYVLPNQIKNGAKLIGQWITETRDEIITIWEYPSYEEYLKIEELVNNNETNHHLQVPPKKLEDFFSVSDQDFLTPTKRYETPKQNVTVSGFITNDKGETLLVKTYWRADTWELPGGGVDEGETLDKAVIREILEETGIHVSLIGICGVYSNGNTITIVFRGTCTGGQLTTSPETMDVRFVKLGSTNVKSYIKRGKFIPRVIDGMNGRCVSYESFKVRPYELIERLSGTEDLL